MPGYSGTPLPQKLGVEKLKSNSQATILLLNAPVDVVKLLGVSSQALARAQQGRTDFVLLFVKSLAELKELFPRLADQLAAAGMLWVAWPKKSSSVASDLSENDIRAVGLTNGLVDVKVCAITDIWSGLKFVVPLKARARHQGKAASHRKV